MINGRTGTGNIAGRLTGAGHSPSESDAPIRIEIEQRDEFQLHSRMTKSHVSGD